MKDIELTVHDTIGMVAQENGLEIDSIQNIKKLVEDIGLRSLDLARIIAVLDSKLEADPFTKLVPITSIKTVGDLCGAYTLFLQGEEAGDEVLSEKGSKRAEARLQAIQLKRGELRKQSRAS